MHVLDGEARPALVPRAAREEQSGERGEREEDEGDEAARPGRYQATLAPAITPRPRSRPAAATNGSPPTSRRERGRDPGSPRASSQSGPPLESRNAALAATSAAMQLPAATVTSAQHESEGRPVRGSIR